MATPRKTPQKSVAKKTAATRRASATVWSKAELDAVRRQLQDEIAHLSADAATIDHQVADLIQDSGDGAGDDAAESGSKAFEREHEQTLANIARDVIVQSRHALQRIDDGSYGTCESCGRPIAKPRLQAFPRATLCVACKQREEHH